MLARATARTRTSPSCSTSRARRDRADPEQGRLQRGRAKRARPTRCATSAARSSATTTAATSKRWRACRSAATPPTGARTATDWSCPSACPCELQNGVDPNRNYGEGWGGIGATMNPYGQTYRGTARGRSRRRRRARVHAHAPGDEPDHGPQRGGARPAPARTARRRPRARRAELKELGDAMADATGYTSQYGWQLYDTSGTTEDWNYAAAGTFGYTIEVGPEDGFFHMPYETGVVNEWNGTGEREGQGMREAFMLSLESAANAEDHSVITGHGTRRPRAPRPEGVPDADEPGVPDRARRPGRRPVPGRGRPDRGRRLPRHDDGRAEGRQVHVARDALDATVRGEPGATRSSLSPARRRTRPRRARRARLPARG